MTILFHVSMFCLAFVLGWALRSSRPLKWRKVLAPEGVDRGPNADPHYQVIVVNKKPHAFTDEAVEVAVRRAFALGFRIDS